MSVNALSGALRAAGLVCRVEARDRLALVVTDDASPLLDATVRARALAMAREHGFTHLALELTAGTPGDHEAGRIAALPRD